MTRSFDHALNTIANIERLHNAYRFDAPVLTEWIPAMRAALDEASTERFVDSSTACEPECAGYIESELTKARMTLRRAEDALREHEQFVKRCQAKEDIIHAMMRLF